MRYCCCRPKILAFWLENAYSDLFLVVLGDFGTCDFVVLTAKGIQLSQKHAF